MRKKHQKNYPSRVRSAGGQTTLQSFLFKPRVADEDLKPSPPAVEEEEPVSPPAPPKREIIRVTNKTIKEKASAFSSVVGSSSSSGKNGDGEAGGASALNAAVFKRFNSSSSAARAESGGGGIVEAMRDADDGGSGVQLDVEEIAAGSSCRRESRKRKSPLGSDEHESSNAKRVVVLGDDPKPRPPVAMRMRRQAKPADGRGEGDRALYNHYASGGGWWHGDMEGVDGEEVGWTDDMWEGMGSITLGGMEWH